LRFGLPGELYIKRWISSPCRVPPGTAAVLRQGRRRLFKQFSTVDERFGRSRYATTVLGVGQLPARFLVMLEATAVD